MAQWQQALVALGAAVALLVVVVLVHTARQLVRLRWQPVRSRTIDRSTMPADVSAVLDTAGPAMQQRGFTRIASEASDRAIVLPAGGLSYSDVYRSADGRVHAVVAPCEPPEPGQPVRIYWITCFADGRNALTFNRVGHFVFALPPQWQADDDYLPTDDAALARHRERIAQRGGPLVTDSSEVLRRLVLFSEGTLGALQQQRLVHAGANGVAQLRWPVALRLAWTLQRGAWRAGRAQGPGAAGASAGDAAASQAPTAPDAVPSTATVDAQVQAFEQQMALQRTQGASPARRWKWLLISALAFVVIGGFWLSWRFAAILLAVVALHEGGHWLAMRLTGFRNLSVFFVPGLGGLAMGEKPSASPMERLFVDLAGPVPGLVLAGLALAGLGSDAYTTLPWLREALIACAAINYLNLLPLLPLDGGRVVETFVFARAPRLRFAFALLGVAALMALALGTGDVVLLVFGVLLATGLPLQWRVSRVARAVPRGRDEVLDEPTAVRRVFAAFEQPAFAGWNFAQRAAVTRSLLPQLQGRRAGWGEAIVGLSIYAACLLGPPVVVAVSAPMLVDAARLLVGASGLERDDVDEPPRPAPPEPLDARLARADALPEGERVALWLEAADQAVTPAEAEPWHAKAWAVVQSRPPHDALRARVRLAQASAASDEQAERTALEQLVAELDGASGEAALTRATALERLAWGVPLAQRVSLQQQALALREAALPRDEARLTEAREMLARSLDAQGDAAQAEALLRANLSAPMPPATDRSPDALRQRTEQVVRRVALGWFLLEHGRVGPAREVAAQARAALPERATVSWIDPQRQLAELQLWSALVAGDRNALARDWGLYESAWKAAAPGGVLPVLVEVDRAATAAALGDADMAAQARAAITQWAARRPANAPPLPLCRGASASEMPTWRDTALRARAEVLKAQGMCPPTAGG